MKVNILIVGGGISGLSIAYTLAKRGIKDILVVDANYIGSGSTGRCATGIRASFTSEEHVVLMKNSIELWKKLSQPEELGKYGLQFDQGGYVWIASKEESVELFKKLVNLHNSLGVPTRVVSPEELKELVPPIRADEAKAALHDPTAGKSYVFDTLHAYIKACKELGVRIMTFTPVRKLVAGGGKVKAAVTDKGSIEADTFIVAAGSGSKKLMESIGVDIPLKNLPRHIMITEAFKPAFKPLVIDWDAGGAPYIVQTKEGNFIIAREIEEEPEQPLGSVRIDFLPKVVSAMAKWFPWIKRIRVLRYWIGYYVTSPDHHPIYGPVDEYENIYLACGYSGHGYMLAPVTGKIITEWLLDGRPSIPQAERLTLRRFKEGRLIEEFAIVG
ncbi:MAG: FAD-binding oxidoreductase [Thermoprotei archaeon]|mgnify:CR=1 FL=1|nr:MAG: FAD-binding oxidoreductase [Thermoprotei archaeon]